MITILMASYNGEKFISEQIESILSQSITDWKLVIQDDCSTDSTYEITGQYAAKYPDKITAMRREKNSGSAMNNFFSMLSCADGDYVMFSDDDDVWLPDKIQETLSAMYRLEKEYGANKPFLVHTDLQVVDEELHKISDFMLRRQNLDSRRCGLNNILVQNIVTGCTMMVNQKLAKSAMSAGIPQHAIMHDWWFALIAATFGKIDFVEQPKVLYRQHDKNEIGAKNAKSLAYNFQWFIEPDKVRQSLSMTYLQAEELLEKFGPILSKESSAIVSDYVSLPHLSKLQKIQMLNVHDFWKTGFAKKCGQLLFI